MIRVGRNIDIEVMADSINITRAVEETFGLKDLTNETRHNIMELVNSLELKSKSLITAELANMGVMVFEIELYDLKEPKKHWWKTFLVAALGVLQIVAGIALMGAGGVAGAPFLNMLGMGMTFSGIGDVLSSIQSFATKTPIDLEFYLKAKAMSYAITITLAGLGAAFDGSNIPGLGDLANQASRALKEGTTRFLLQGFAVQGLMMGVQPLLSKAADRAVEHNRGNLEASAWRRVDGLFSYYNEAFKRIHVAEKVLNSNQYSSSILSETRQIVQDENKRFKGDGANYGIGVASGAMGNLAGAAAGFGPIGGFFATRAFDAGLHGILGGVKSGEVLDRSVEKLGHRVEEIAASVPKTAKLLEMRLHARFDTKVKEVSTPLMAVLAANKFIDNTGDINYKDCRKIKTFAFAESYKQYMQVLVDGCEEINRAMDLGQEPAKKVYEKWSFTLKRAIQSVFAGGLSHIMKQDVVAPQINIWGGGAIKEGWSWVVDKLLESLPFLKPKPKKEEPAPEKAAGNDKEEKPEEPQKPKKKPERKRPKEEEAQESRTGGGSKPKPKGNKPKDKPAANDNAANDNTYGPQPCRDDTCNAGGYNNGESSTNPDHGRVLAAAAFKEKVKNLLRDNISDPEKRKEYEEALFNTPLGELGQDFATVDAEQSFWNRIRFVANAEAAHPAQEVLKEILKIAPLLFASLWGAQKDATQQQKEFDYRRNNDRQEEEMRRNLKEELLRREFRARAGGSAPMPDPDAWEPDGNQGLTSEQRIQNVIDETINSNDASFTSRHVLTEDEALEAGRKWLGEGYREIGRPGSGVYRSADGLRQFRIDDNSLLGRHNPYKPHVHLEKVLDNGRTIIARNHILIKR